MEFKLPFLSLKSLSSLRICQHWANHKLGPFKNFWTTLYSEQRTLSHLILDGLQIHPSLKAVVGDVLFGTLGSLTYWSYHRRKIRLAEEVQFFHFDAFGRFDEKRTLKPVFQKKVAEEDDLPSLHKLLTEAYDFWLLPEADAILRKMVAIASNRRGSEILKEGPRHELRHGKDHFVYRFVQEDAAQSLETIRYLDSADRASIVLDRESIAVTPCPETRYWNFDAFKDHFDLLEPPETRAFVADVMNCLKNVKRWDMGIANQLDIFAYLVQNYYGQYWMWTFKFGFFRFLKQFLLWPFISIFIIALKHLAPRLTFDDYGYIFWITVEYVMPADPQCGVLHIDLLLYIWSVFTTDEKHKFAISQTFYELAKNLKVKAPFLHDAIKSYSCIVQCYQR